MNLKNVFLTFILFISFNYTNAFEPGVVSGSVNATINSCGYFSSVTGLFNIKYRNECLKCGTRVILILGDKNKANSDSSITTEWENRRQLELEASAPYEWSQDFSQNIVTRGVGYQLAVLDLVLKIVFPDDSVAFDNGMQSPWGFYSTTFDLPLHQMDPCHSPNTDIELIFDINNR